MTNFLGDFILIVIGAFVGGILAGVFIILQIKRNFFRPKLYFKNVQIVPTKGDVIGENFTKTQVREVLLWKTAWGKALRDRSILHYRSRLKALACIGLLELDDVAAVEMKLAKAIKKALAKPEPWLDVDSGLTLFDMILKCMRL